jgi:hypothetical protein
MEQQNKKWYQKTVWIILFLIFLFPVGLFLMWKYSRWSLKVKWILGIVFGLLYIIGFASAGNKSSPPNITNVTKNINAQAQPTETPQPAEKFNIEVKSDIVKKVDGKYRYFFDIRNNDSKSFEGTVTIALFTSESKNPLAGDTFSTKSPIESNLGTSVYTDAHTGPVSVHGANGMVKFVYTVKKDDKVVNSGEGQITDKLEDLSGF